MVVCATKFQKLTSEVHCPLNCIPLAADRIGQLCAFPFYSFFSGEPQDLVFELWYKNQPETHIEVTVAGGVGAAESRTAMQCINVPATTPNHTVGTLRSTFRVSLRRTAITAAVPIIAPLPYIAAHIV